MPHPLGRGGTGASTHRRRPRALAALGATAALCVVALATAGAALADVGATSTANGPTVAVSTPGPVLSGVTESYTVTVTNVSTAPTRSPRTTR